MPKDDRAYIFDIVEAAQRAQQFVSNTSREAFLNDPVLCHAVTRQFEIIGEAASRVSKEFKERFADLPWRPMIGMRNRLVHDYTNTNFTIIWDAVQVDLQPLIEALAKIPPELK